MAGKVLLTPGNRLHIKLDLAGLIAMIEGMGEREYPAIHATGSQLLALFDPTPEPMILVFTDIKRLSPTYFIARYIGPVPVDALDLVREIYAGVKA